MIVEHPAHRAFRRDVARRRRARPEDFSAPVVVSWTPNPEYPMTPEGDADLRAYAAGLVIISLVDGYRGPDESEANAAQIALAERVRAFLNDRGRVSAENFVDSVLACLRGPV